MANKVSGAKMATRGEIGKKIRLARKRLGYTQKSLSEKTKVNKTTISEIENGRFTGSFDIFERVLDGVGLQFEVNKKNLTCPNGMKLKQYFRKMMNEIIYKLYHLVFTSNNAKSTTT